MLAGQGLKSFLLEAESRSTRFEITLGEARIEILSNIAGMDAIIGHTLGPHVDVKSRLAAQGQAGDWSVCAFAAPDYDRLLSALTDTPADAPFPGRLAPYWRSDFAVTPLRISSTWAVVRHFAPFIGLTLFDAQARRLVFIHPEPAPLYIPHLEHLVGYALRSCFWARGFVDVHAAFVRYRGKGVALIGPRGAGKTSLAMHLLQRGGAMLGSDMAQIRLAQDGAIVAQAIPHMYRITRETIWDNALLEAVIGSQFDANTDYFQGPLFSYGKYEAYDSSMESIVGRRVAISTMAVDGLIFPKFSADLHRQSVEPLTERTGKQRLIWSIAHDRPLADWLPFDLAGRDRAEGALEEGLIGEASPPLKSVQLHFGKQPSLLWEDLDAMIDAL